MKNILKTFALSFLITTLASCYSGSPNGKLDSVANHDNHAAGGATTVDTLPKTIDSTKTDTSR